MNKALSSTDILAKKYKTFHFEGKFYEAFGQPSTSGMWFIWGQSGNGKNNFLLQLAKYLTKFERILWVELEEFDDHTFQKAWQDQAMDDCGRKIQVVPDQIDELKERLRRRQSRNIVIINSFQYTGLSFNSYLALKREFPKKLFIICSQAEGKMPLGKTAVRVMYDATLKIFVEGFQAMSKGRYIGPNGGTYIIWEKGAKLFGLTPTSKTEMDITEKTIHNE